MALRMASVALLMVVAWLTGCVLGMHYSKRGMCVGMLLGLAG